MDSTELSIRLLAGVVLTGMNALFVLTEFALTRAPGLGKEAFSGERALRLAWKMTERLEVYLTGCQLGISATSILLGIVAEPAVTQLLSPVPAWFGLSGGRVEVVSIVLSVVVINLVHKIWGEQAPTYFGVEAPVRAARIGAPLLYAWTRLFYPLVMAGDGIAKLTLRLFGIRVTRSWAGSESAEAGPGTDAADAADAGSAPNTDTVNAPNTDAAGRASMPPRAQLLHVLGKLPIPHDRRDEVLGAYDIADTAVADIMVPRHRIEFLSTESALPDNLDVVQRSPKARYPLCGRRLDDVVGMIYVPALLANVTALVSGERPLSDFAVEAMWLDADTTVDAAVDAMQARRHEIALVRREGRLVGLVTQTDAFERIVGALEDPFDAPGG